MARDIFTKFRRRARQFEATRGRPIAPSVSRRFLEAELSSEAERASIESAREENILASREARSQRAEEIKSQAQANVVSGITGIGTTAAVLSDTELGKTTGGFIKGAAKRVAPSLVTTGTTAAAIPSTAGTAVGGLTGAEFATPFTTEAVATGAAPSVVGAAASTVLPAVVGGFVGSKISEAIGGEGKGQRNTGRTLGSAAAGFAFGGPLGGAIGGVIGLAQAETVICTELNRQGYIGDGVLELDGEWRVVNISENTYIGYMRWAPAVVRAMQKSRVVTWLVKPFGVGWARHTAHQINSNITGSYLGWTLLKVGAPICELLGRNKWLIF